MFCPECGKDLPETAKFCEGCGTSIAKVTSPKKVSMAAWITIGLMILGSFFAVIAALGGNTTEDGTFPLAAFLIESIVGVVILGLVIFLVAQGVHKLATQRWIDFRGPTGQFLR